MSPKRFCRVRRLQNLLRLVESAPTMSWADAAITCGYYDQAHCINEFQALAGLSPTAYLACRGVQMNHVPIQG